MCIYSAFQCVLRQVMSPGFCMRKADGAQSNEAKNLLTVFSLISSANTHLSLPIFTHHNAPTHTHVHTDKHTNALSVAPHGGQDDLVEQVVVELFGHFVTGPLHSHGGGETEDDAQAAEHTEHRQIPGVAEATVL